LKCEVCGENVECPEHGEKWIVKEYSDLDGSVFYYCEKCVVEYATALGAIVHDHIFEKIIASAKEMGVKVEGKPWWQKQKTTI
jgi:hypothetical protein